ncbi:MAG: M20/M25/M40 family metallo-hydrolase, partial [Woeseiaceae bacterium]
MRQILVFVTLVACVPAGAQQSYLIDWDDVGEEAVQHFVNLIRINTTNPPGNETEVTDYLGEVLAGAGIEYEVLALEQERANLVTRIKGNGSKQPILLMGHTDVVGVQRDKWFEDPFSGLRQDGWIYGRGTLDDKDHVA